MDLQKLAQLAKSNPNAAKAFLNKKSTETSSRPVKKEDKVFTERQLKMIVETLVKGEVAKIPTPKDGKTPTKEEITQLIKPLMPVLRQPKDGKDAEVTPDFVDKVANQVLKQVAVTPDLSEAILKVFSQEKVKAENIPGFTELKERVEQLARNQKYVGQGKGIAAGYTDTDVKRVIDSYGGGSSLPDQTGNSGKFLTTDGTDPSWATLAGGGDMAAATYDPQTIAADAFDTDNHTDGTTNKVFTATEKTKLGTVETNADVTDTTNVTAAGALMDSEVTNLAQVKAFDSANYATAAQGALADSASQPGHTHVAANITDFDTEVSNNTDVAANTAARHDAVTVTDSAEIDFTLTGQNITAALVADSIDETKLDTSVNASLDLADSALQNVVEDTTPQLGGSLDVNGQKIVSVSNGNIDIEPNGTGNVLIGNFTLDADQTVGAGQDNYVLTYDDSTGLISLEAAAGGAGDAWSDPVDADIVPDVDSTRDLGSPASRFSQIWADQLYGLAQFDSDSAAFSINDSNSLPMFKLSSVGPTAVNEITLGNSATGNAATASATGSDTNISLNLVPKGSGEAQVAGERILDETDLASPTFTGTTTADLFVYDAARGKVTAGGNLGATETINFNDETNYTGTLDSNITFTFANATSGDEVTLFLSYDSTAQRTITWPTITWLDNATGAAPTTPAASGNVLVVTVRYIGTTYYGSATGNYAVYS